MLGKARIFLAAGAVGALAATLAPALASDRGQAAAKRPTRTLFLTAVEFKGTANVSSEPFPATAPPS